MSVTRRRSTSACQATERDVKTRLSRAGTPATMALPTRCRSRSQKPASSMSEGSSSPASVTELKPRHESARP